MIVKQFAIILGAIFIGNEIVRLTGIPMPANVLGLLLLLLALCLKIIKLKDVEDVANFIIKYMTLFFIVPTVGIMVYFDVIGKDLLKIIIPLFVSIILGMFVAGKVTELMIARIRREKDE